MERGMTILAKHLDEWNIFALPKEAALVQPIFARNMRGVKYPQPSKSNDPSQALAFGTTWSCSKPLSITAHWLLCGFYS